MSHPQVGIRVPPEVVHMVSFLPILFVARQRPTNVPSGFIDVLADQVHRFAVVSDVGRTRKLVTMATDD